MKEVPHAIICECCDAVCQRVPLREREIARCPRCGGELDRHGGRQQARILPLTVASLIVFAIANLFPIVEIELRGLRSETTLLGAVIALAGDGRSLLALLVLATTLLMPLLHLLILLWLLVPLRWGQGEGRRVAGFAPLVRAMQALRPWGMIDIFLLGVLVAIIKLSGMATVLPGPALWAFMALTVLLAVVTAFDPRRLWAMVDGVDGVDGVERVDGVVEPASLSGCRHCGTVWDGAIEGQACARCDTVMQARKSDSLNRTWAYLITACVLYLPANLLPVMVTRTLFGTHSDTILSGVIYFWSGGAYGLAAIVFVASFLVPLFKLVALFMLVLLAQRRSDWRRSERARLYHLIELLGRWSMLDVFVVVLLVGLVRIQGFAEISAGVGIVAFGAVVVLTMLASLSFDPKLSWNGPASAGAEVEKIIPDAAVPANETRP